MNYRKIAYFIMTLSFIMIMSGGVSSFLLGLKADREETYNRINEVSDEFEVFSTNTTVFENFRDDLYNVVFSNVYFDSMYADDIEVKNKLSNYENLVDELTKNTNVLNSLCDNVYFPDSNVNNKCKNYKSIYEQVVNYFITDVNLYNSNIDKYNAYQSELNSLIRIKKYETKKVYIDYNNDGKYDGKEE